MLGLRRVFKSLEEVQTAERDGAWTQNMTQTRGMYSSLQSILRGETPGSSPAGKFSPQDATAKIAVRFDAAQESSEAQQARASRESVSAALPATGSLQCVEEAGLIEFDSSQGQALFRRGSALAAKPQPQVETLILEERNEIKNIMLGLRRVYKSVEVDKNSDSSRAEKIERTRALYSTLQVRLRQVKPAPPPAKSPPHEEVGRYARASSPALDAAAPQAQAVAERLQADLESVEIVVSDSASALRQSRVSGKSPALRVKARPSRKVEVERSANTNVASPGMGQAQAKQRSRDYEQGVSSSASTSSAAVGEKRTSAATKSRQSAARGTLSSVQPGMTRASLMRMEAARAKRAQDDQAAEEQRAAEESQSSTSARATESSVRAAGSVKSPMNLSKSGRISRLEEPERAGSATGPGAATRGALSIRQTGRVSTAIAQDAHAPEQERESERAAALALRESGRVSRYEDQASSAPADGPTNANASRLRRLSSSDSAPLHAEEEKEDDLAESLASAKPDEKVPASAVKPQSPVKLLRSVIETNEALSRFEQQDLASACSTSKMKMTQAQEEERLRTVRARLVALSERVTALSDELDSRADTLDDALRQKLYTVVTTAFQKTQSSHARLRELDLRAEERAKLHADVHAAKKKLVYTSSQRRVVGVLGLVADSTEEKEENSKLEEVRRTLQELEVAVEAPLPSSSEIEDGNRNDAVASVKGETIASKCQEATDALDEIQRAMSLRSSAAMQRATGGSGALRMSGGSSGFSRGSSKLENATERERDSFEFMAQVLDEMIETDARKSVARSKSAISSGSKTTTTDDNTASASKQVVVADAGDSTQRASD
ncbi:unnamed protein product, partial [Amoebophrya sp. A25]|eukprot:GSA25T00001171001.1